MFSLKLVGHEHGGGRVCLQVCTGHIGLQVVPAFVQGLATGLVGDLSVHDMDQSYTFAGGKFYRIARLQLKFADAKLLAVGERLRARCDLDWFRLEVLKIDGFEGLFNVELARGSI